MLHPVYVHLCLFSQVCSPTYSSTMLCLVRAARQQLCQALVARRQWLKCAPPCTAAGPAHTYPKRWRGDRRLVALPFQWEDNQPFVILANVVPFLPFCTPVFFFSGCSDALVSFLSLCDSEQKRRMKAEKKAAEKEAKVKDQQQEQKDSNDKDLPTEEEETLDPNVSVSGRWVLSHWQTKSKSKPLMSVPSWVYVGGTHCLHQWEFIIY